MTKTAAQYLAETLQQAGVKRVYGVVGDSLNGFTDALRRLGSIDWIHMRHEEGAAFAAGAEAQITGKLAVCAGSSGRAILQRRTGTRHCSA
jgi:pyruvate dehydrogenase (quinone)